MVNPCMADRIEGGWGIPATRVDGSDAIATLVAVRVAVEAARAGGGPQAVEAVTLRLDGHAAHDDGSYMDQIRLKDYVAQRDPIERLAARLRLDGLSDGRGRRRCARPPPTRSSAGLAEAEASPAPDPATFARRRLRDEADVSDAAAIAARVRAFVRDVVIPAEARDEGAEHGPSPELRDELQAAARAAGLFAPHVGAELRRARARHARAGAVFEEAGYSLLGPLALNCSAPDEGNMHLLEVVASDEQKERYLRPLAAGDVRSASR